MDSLAEDCIVPLEQTNRWYTDTARYHAGHGLKWDQIREDYLARCSPEEYEAMTSKSPFDEKGSMRRRDKIPALLNRDVSMPRPLTAGANGSPTGVRTDPQKEQDATDMYVKSGASPASIGLALGLHRATVRRILLERTNYDPAEWMTGQRRSQPAYKEPAHADQ